MNLGFPEMMFIFVLALIIFGPKKLPEIGRQIGKALAEFKKASNEFKWQLEAEMRNLEAEANQIKQDLPKIEPPSGTIVNHFLGTVEPANAAAAEADPSPAPPAGSNGHAAAGMSDPEQQTKPADA
ncbi:MAG TPA: TatA/E family twin arginine-targeting protein translocase [Terriglobales bacterium]|nr:TatA/E family twin arginine-targeting protein translocase [Terriglobales bacterium]